jgi:hypothetical protein
LSKHNRALVEEFISSHRNLFTREVYDNATRYFTD